MSGVGQRVPRFCLSQNLIALFMNPALQLKCENCIRHLHQALAGRRKVDAERVRNGVQHQRAGPICFYEPSAATPRVPAPHIYMHITNTHLTHTIRT